MDDLRVEPLGPIHDRDRFDCGETALNNYLRRQASQDMRRRVAQIFVSVPPDQRERIAGYYGLSAASFDRDELPSDIAKRLPHYPVPSALLARLGVDREHQGKGVGEFLLLDALDRVLRASATLAVYAVVVDAKGEAAAGFYARYGFRAFPTKPLRLFLPLETIAASGL